MEKQAKCRWCGHERCFDCQKDKWPELQDACCQCRRNLLPVTYGTPKDETGRIKTGAKVRSAYWGVFKRFGLLTSFNTKRALFFGACSKQLCPVHPCHGLKVGIYCKRILLRFLNICSVILSLERLSLQENMLHQFCHCYAIA
jgi:hypothetical protein